MYIQPHPWSFLKSRICMAFVLLTLVLGTAGLSGCGTLIPTVKPVTITFSFPATDRAYYESLKDKFRTENPQIIVELKPWTANPTQSELATDVIVLTWDMALYSQSQTVQASLPLDILIDQDRSFNRDDFYPGTLKAFSDTGKVYAIPSGLDPWVMFYNKDLFDQYNVPYPKEGWTWDDFLAIASALTHSDIKSFGFTTLPNSPDPFFFLMQHGGKLVDDSGRPTFLDPLNIESMEWYTRLFSSNEVALSPKRANEIFGYSNESTWVAIYKGNVGMWTGNLSQRGGMNQTNNPWKFSWGVAPLPKDQVAFTGASYEGLAISAKSQNQDASWKWITFLSKQVPYRLMPARISVAEASAFENQAGKEVAAAARMAMKNAILADPATTGSILQAVQVFMGAVQKMLDGQMTVKEALTWGQAQAQ
jgi:multiple sugar transport system substrate-binding protein